MEKFGLVQKLLTNLIFCLFEGNRRLFFELTGDTAAERVHKSLKTWLDFFRKFLYEANWSSG